jgi:hypothetical protein
MTDDATALLFKMGLGGEKGRPLFLRSWLNLCFDNKAEKAKWLYDQITPQWRNEEDKQIIDFILDEIVAAMKIEAWSGKVHRATASRGVKVAWHTKLVLAVIEATKDKLDEARFFLGHMRAEAAKVIRQHPEAFGHYFSAFITAARSVPWVLQCEQNEKYRVWINIWNAAKTDEERELEEFTNERRRRG